MSYLDDPGFWSKLWSAAFMLVVTFVVVADFTAVFRGHRDGVGDKFTLTHWLVVHIGLSIIGAFIGYLVAHFLIVHHNG